MSYYTIGIGGTGAKCVEALIHLSAAGMMPEGNLYALFVDPDVSNGCLSRTKTTLSQYINCKDNLELGKTDLFKTHISEAQNNNTDWDPLRGIDTNNKNLRNLYLYDILSPNEARLFDVLYSNAEINQELDVGFRGHPSIGSAVIARMQSLEGDEPWTSFWNMIIKDAGQGGSISKIFLFGSIFGGTGAAGFPTIARLICKELENKHIDRQNVWIGGALLLPYFSFNKQNINGLTADSAYFVLNTQMALKYYSWLDSIGIFDAVYLIGNEQQSNVDFSVGGNQQTNKAHFVELYSGLAGIDFFNKTKINQDGNKYFIIATDEQKKIEWTDLPDNESGGKIKKKIGQLTRFAFAYRAIYYPALKAINAKNEKEYKFPWFVDFFERGEVSLGKEIDNSLKNVNEYCESFLTWLVNIHEPQTGEQIELINYNAFNQVFSLDKFDNLLKPTGEDRPRALGKLWNHMSNAKVEDSNAKGVGRFIRALYDGCAIP